MVFVSANTRLSALRRAKINVWVSRNIKAQPWEKFLVYDV